MKEQLIEIVEKYEPYLDHTKAIDRQQKVVAKMLAIVEESFRELEAISALGHTEKLKDLSVASLNCVRSWKILQTMTVERMTDELAKAIREVSEHTLLELSDDDYDGLTLDDNRLEPDQ